MKAILTLVSVLLVLATSPTYADDRTDIPPIVAQGFEEFRKNGTLAAMNIWLDGSARDNDEDQDRAAAKMNGIQGLFGRMLGYEIVRWVPLSSSTQRGYAAVKFEKGVAWMSFDCYRPDKSWIISRFDFATNANLILPPNILGGQR